MNEKLTANTSLEMWRPFPSSQLARRLQHLQMCAESESGTEIQMTTQDLDGDSRWATIFWRQQHDGMRECILIVHQTESDDPVCFTHVDN